MRLEGVQLGVLRVNSSFPDLLHFTTSFCDAKHQTTYLKRCSVPYTRNGPYLEWHKAQGRPVGRPTSSRVLRLHVDLCEDRVFLDERAARRDIWAHQILEDLVGVERVLNRHVQHRARGRVEGRLPELLGVHLA